MYKNDLMRKIKSSLDRSYKNALQNPQREMRIAIPLGEVKTIRIEAEIIGGLNL